MKKIVALVLSLVMVLGLATTAFGATAYYDVYTADGELYNTTTAWSYEIQDADPIVDGEGSVEWVQLTAVLDKTTTSDDQTLVNYYVECAKADAEYYLTVEDKETAVMYLKEVARVDFEVGYDFTNIGAECGQLNVSAKYDYYYTKNADGTQDFWKAAKDMGGSYALLVNGELVQVTSAGNTYSLVAHDWEILTIDEDHTVTSVKCEECGLVCDVYETKLAAPKGAFPSDYGWLFPVVADAPATDADKVESAETFDAGIAMYVGMSVMAAAGSAVVLKKKD